MEPGFQWFPFVGQLLLLACHIFNLERAYRLHHRKLWPIFTIVPFMCVIHSPRTATCMNR